MSENFTILIIDDEPLILSSLSTVLSDRFNVVTAEEGISGLTMFSRHHPSVVLLDVEMPWMNGIEVLAKIREMDKTVPVFVMTGGVNHLDSFWSQRCAELGVSGFVVKPVSPAKLIKQIEKALK